MIEISVLSGGSIGTNCYILQDQKNNAALIDFVPEAEDYLIKNNLKIKILFLTHIHFDHIEGLAVFQKKNNFDFCLSSEAYDFFKNPSAGSSILSFFPPDIMDNIKNISLNNTKILSEGGSVLFDYEAIKAFKSPGHSPDGLIFSLDNYKIIFSGDTLFYGSVGRTDLPGGDFTEIEKSIKRIYSLFSDDYKVFPGHGPATSIGFERKNNPYVRA